jgi:hypothetical protein
MSPSDAAATRFAPSAEEAMAVQELWGALVFIQLWAEAGQAAMEATITARASRMFMVVIFGVRQMANDRGSATAATGRVDWNRRAMQRMVRPRCCHHRKSLSSVSLTVLAVVQPRSNELPRLSLQHDKHFSMRLVTLERHHDCICCRDLRQHLQSGPQLSRETRNVRGVLSCLCYHFVFCHTEPLCLVACSATE